MSNRHRKHRKQQRDLKRGTAMHEFQLASRRALTEADRAREAGEDDGFWPGTAGLDGVAGDDHKQ